MGEICLRNRVVVLADEIHCDFVTAGNKYTPFASLPDKEIVNNSLTFKAASKTFSLAAMKAAWYFLHQPQPARARPFLYPSGPEHAGHGGQQGRDHRG